ncbi:hypothetical protein [Pseudomonas sp. NPDC089396]|uniref:hypothetical protein n=1 Tax=Pseudomonas sp. NPDC089396 TaxID=3364461 RepID=UPI003835F972
MRPAIPAVMGQNDSLKHLGDRVLWESTLEEAMYATDDEMKIRKFGRVSITKEGISVEGFDVKGAMCRDVAVMAAAWAIGELQREMLKTIAKPGGGKISVD